MSKKKIKLTSILLLSMLFMSSVVLAQGKHVVKGSVLDETNQPLIGATVVVKNVKNTGVITDVDGKFTINVPDGQNTLVVSYIGYNSQDVSVTGKNNITVRLADNTVNMDEVVVVGYGQQKKASVVGSITQTTGDKLTRTGGVSSLGAALTGNLPGVSTMQTTSKPGEEDPQIIIRGISSWNNSSPLVLVDGIERSMSSVDINSVESISVLKDASATAVYGVKGANGVILITTKRGVEGKAKIDVGFSSTMKVPGKLPGKYDAYDAMEIKNNIVEYEMSTIPNSWNYIRPQSFIDNYRNQTTQEQKERYPNIDWQKEMFKDYAMSYNANINISGGTKFVKYFAAMDYVHEGDITRIFPNDRGYDVSYGYNRANTRANLDFNITNSTKFKVNLFGSYGAKSAPGYVIREDYLWAGAYGLPANVFYPKYSDGTWGYCPTNGVSAPNSEANLANGGEATTTTTRLTTDFALNQDLGMLLKGLSANLTVSLDNSFIENNRGITDMYVTVRQKYIDPVTGIPQYASTNDANTNFDFYPTISWSNNGGGMDGNSTYRNLNYQAQLLYNGRFGDHNVTAMGNFQRRQYATGAMVQSLREDWVFRTTYNYKGKYFAEYNGAYNGSEKFASKNRFGFFSSGAIGWMLSEEKFMKDLTFLDMLKLRATYGEIGDDSSGNRWLYQDVWNNSTSQAFMTNTLSENSPYKYNTQTQIGNPNIGWEKVTKRNIGTDFSFFKNLIAGSVDVFKDNRSNIIMNGNTRSVPSYFGMTPPTANLGKTEVHGYEIDLRLSKNLNRNLRLWGNFSMTHAVSKVIDQDDPALLADYLKKAGFPVNQVTSTISHGYYNTWDQLYGSTAFDVNDSKIPGNYRIVDFNSDGVINATTDKAPYAYPTNPENTYNATIGVDWKGFSAFVQFYGVNNVSRYIGDISFGFNYLDLAYKEGSYWTKSNTNADTPNPRVNNTALSDASWGTRYMYDGSYIRLKNAEISYTLDSKAVKSFGLQSLRIFVNGNDLFLWTKTPDDREVNGGTSYPLVKRFNLGLKVTL
ncbi:SusC/RagA family TonB-linked outer membrane protein [Paludibacter propionicigenes]|nr:TonB-dependent receptor [Paludibacter propionicigenes]